MACYLIINLVQLSVWYKISCFLVQSIRIATWPVLPIIWRTKLRSWVGTTGKVILESVILTAVVVVSLTLYTFWAARRGHDFSFLGPFLFAALMILIVFALIQVTRAFSIYQKSWFRGVLINLFWVSFKRSWFISLTFSDPVSTWEDLGHDLWRTRCDYLLWIHHLWYW